MAAVRQTNTTPEMTVRKVLWQLGYRYRLHRRDLPGKPDIVFPGQRKAVFVHGCFWHGHECARNAKRPVSNSAYWNEKITKNKVRDQASISALSTLGWTVLVVWECETKDTTKLTEKLNAFLEASQTRL